MSVAGGTTRRLAALALAGLLAPACPAQTISGVGARDCAAFTFAVGRESEEALDAYVSWTQGYISAFNLNDPHGRNLAIHPTGIIHWLAGYCRTRPDAPFHAAVSEFVKVHAR